MDEAKEEGHGEPPEDDVEEVAKDLANKAAQEDATKAAEEATDGEASHFCSRRESWGMTSWHCLEWISCIQDF